jgi:hypothetical protein
MLNGQALLRQDLLDVARDERVSQIPANAEENDHVIEVPPRGTVLAVFGSR